MDTVFHRLDSANTPFTAAIQVQTAGGAGGFLLLADGVSYLLLADGVSKLILEGGVSVITIAGSSITSDTGAISFGDDNITTTGIITGGSANIGNSTNYTEIKADGEINLHGTAKVYKQHNFVFNYSKITGQGAPTLVERGIFQGFSLPVYDADDEELHACICIPDDWDGATDPVLYVGGWLDTANTTKKFKLQVSVEVADFENNAVVPITTNDIEVETTTGTWSQYTAFKVAFTIDHSAVLGAVGQPFAIRIRRIDASADEITGEVVVEGALVRYVADKIGGTT